MEAVGPDRTPVTSGRIRPTRCSSRRPARGAKQKKTHVASAAESYKSQKNSLKMTDGLEAEERLQAGNETPNG